ncbi:hypothetical protein J4Q44_G00337920 [Coregonus suidteri]|uniref:Uncharacterized protein n=1 Tax=Coregonus suidteri TaxID=861788 RepID=A0AAN8KJS7_9TELE
MSCPCLLPFFHKGLCRVVAGILLVPRVFQEARGRPGGVFNWLCEQVMSSNAKHYSINPQEKSGGGTT